MFVLLATMTTVSLTAQHVHGAQCGVGLEDGEMIVERLLRNRERMGELLAQRSGGTIYIPVKFQLVAETNGTGRPTEKQCLDALCRMNTNYAPYNIQFFLHSSGFAYRNNSTIFNHTNSTSAQFLMNSFKTQNCLNIFVGNSAGGVGTGGGTTLGYYTPAYDLIFAIKSTVNANSPTLTHEAGHFFSLPHPFFGWESLTHTCNMTLPTNAENQARTGTQANCATAGDRFCDTGPDYALGFDPSANDCSYNGCAVDRFGVAIDPNENNYMGYFNDNCVTEFTPQQVAAVNADIVDRNWHNITPPTTANVGGAVTIVAPQNNTTVPTFNGVFIQWNAVQDASNYYYEVYRALNGNQFGNVLLTGTTNQTGITLTTLLANTAYIVKVMPYNAYRTCNTFTNVLFTTGDVGVGVENLSNINAFSAVPNPLVSGQSLSVNIEANSSFEANLKLYSINGQLVQNMMNLSILNGSNTVQVSTENLPKGVYILNIETPQGVMNDRIMIME